MTTHRAAAVAIIGDLAGHSAQLRSTLERLGVGFDTREVLAARRWEDVGIDWPAGLHVVQVGDLVHRGPDSVGIVLLVERLIGRGVWTQVVGNHEQHYVDRPRFHWPEVIDPAASSILRAWWKQGRMAPAAVVETAESGDWLVTHGGLTAGYWDRVLGRPQTRADLLDALGQAAADDTLWNPGRKLTGKVNRDAGPVWAEAGYEVYPSWLDAPAPSPFHQVHGHSSAYWWEEREWHCDTRVSQTATLDQHARHLTLTHAGRCFVGVDPGHGTDPAPSHAPLLLRDATVHTRPPQPR